MSDVKHTAPEAEMELPAGKTCADCRHIRRCTLFGFSTALDTSCDFYPSRFVEAKASGETP